MGLRDAFSKKGGGRLNNVDATVVDYEFSTTFPYEAKGKTTGKKSTFNTLWFNASIKTDGAEEAVVEPIFAGDADQWDISEDGHSVSPKEGADRASFFGSIVPLLDEMITAGFPEPDYEAGGDIDLSSLVGERFRFVQVVDEEATKRMGKQIDKKDPKKSYDRKRLGVTEYHGAVEEVAAAPAKTSTFARGGKTNGAAKNAKNVKTKEADELVEYADSVLVDLLTAAKGNTIKKADLGSLSTRKLLGNPKRLAVQKLLSSDEYLGRENGWGYDGGSKAQTISLTD